MQDRTKLYSSVNVCTIQVFRDCVDVVHHTTTVIIHLHYFSVTITLTAHTHCTYTYSPHTVTYIYSPHTRTVTDIYSPHTEYLHLQPTHRVLTSTAHTQLLWYRSAESLRILGSLERSQVYTFVQN